MNIGILTFHDGLNHGAFLQAYATMRTLQNLGHKVTIINYKNINHYKQEGWRQMLKFRRPIRFLDYYKKYKSFNKDQKLFIQTPFTTNPMDVKKMKFDGVVIGSDVVWNYKIFGLDDLYFGNLDAERKISYAASFGWVNESDNHPKEIKPWLDNFDHVSVRDKNSANIYKKLTKKSTTLVLDPTLIFDFSADIKKNNWSNVFGPYLLIYSFVTDPSQFKKVREYAKNNGLKTVAVGYRHHWADFVKMDISPLEWIDLFQQATAIATSTYHGFIFAIKTKRDFFYIKNKKAFNRISHLALLFSMDSRLQQNTTGCIEVTPEYDTIVKFMKPHVQASINWLHEAVK